ncbi:MAG: right-handed parallel beta-helix repeat-containing protein [Methanosarcina sp.]
MDGGIRINKLITLLLAFLILASISFIGAAAEIFVQPGNSIQNSINNADSGDIIIVKPGTYTENVRITKDNLTIKSESENPDDTIIKAKSPSAHVFFLQADNVKIKGLKISGARRYGYAGICLSSCNNCTIENNKLLNNSFGAYLLSSKGNTISKNIVSNSERGIYFNISESNTLSGNTATNNREYGIMLASSIGNSLSGNTASNNERGLYLSSSDGNTILSNIIQNNNIFGLFVCGKCDKVRFYNNYFNDTNITIKSGIGNAYNTTKTAGTNIVGGPSIGGNYWAKPDGTGFSQTAVDKDEDGISDSAYVRITGSIYSDFLPLVITSKPPIPVANFWGSPKSGDTPLNVSFTDISTGEPTAWSWSFGDGTYSTQQSPVHTYSTAGTYTIALTVSNAAGAGAMTKPNYINVTASQKPVANFWGIPTSGDAPLNVSFTDNTTGEPTARDWSFGDKTYSTQQNPKHTYSAAGNYTVTLTSSNTAGSSTQTKTNYIVVTALQKPVANFWGSPKSGNVSLNVTFTDISKGSPTAWNWSFGDGKYSAQQNPVHTYSAAGIYTVVLTVSNAAGAMTKPNYINVTASQKPVANLWGTPTSGNAPLNVTFIDNTTGAPTALNWSFGDGTYSTVKNPSHTYSAAGNYTVKLTASNTAGASTQTKTNYINVVTALQKPVANFWGSPKSGNTPLIVAFTDISTGTPTAWNWSFGDGTSSKVKSPKHTYSVAGNYTVKLTVSNKAGIGMMTKNSYIKAGKS